MTSNSLRPVFRKLWTLTVVGLLPCGPGLRSYAQAPVISPATPVVNQGRTISFTCTANCGTGGTWSCSGCAGSINSSTGVYTAPASIKAQQQLAGYQLLPNNAVFNVDISGLPASAITGAPGNFSLWDSFPLNYVTNST